MRTPLFHIWIVNFTINLISGIHYYMRKEEYAFIFYSTHGILWEPYELGSK